MTALLKESHKPIFAGIRDALPTWLSPLTVKPCPVHEALGFRNTAGNRICLTAHSWKVLARGRSLAECRMAVIRGTALEIVNVMIFPVAPKCVPVFVAEVLVTGGVPRMAFVDLQSAGLEEPASTIVKQTAAALRGRHTHLPPGSEPPEWAVRHSLGEFVFTQPGDKSYKEDLQSLVCDAVQTWADVVDHLAPATHTGGPTLELQQFKADHVRESPVAPYLGKLFGPEWADQFLNHFLYR